MVLSTSAMSVGTAIVNTMEIILTCGRDLISWIKSSPFQVLLLIFVCDRASGNLLFFKMFRVLQILCTGVFLLLWFEPCGVHITARIMNSHLDRYSLRKPLSMTSRIFKYGKYNDRFMSHVAQVVGARLRFRRGPPPSTTPPQAERDELKRLLLLDEQQRQSSLGNPIGSVAQSQLSFHLIEVFSILNYDLTSDLLWHWCTGCCEGPEDCVTRLTYHYASLHTSGCPIFVPSRFTKMFGAPSHVGRSVCISNLGLTVFEVSFTLDVRKAEEYLRNEPVEDNGEINYKAEGSKRLITAATTLKAPTLRFRLVLFLALGMRMTRLMWVLFSNEDRPNRPFKSMRDVANAVDDVLKDLRDCLRPGHPVIGLLMAYRPSSMTEADVYVELRASVFCISSDTHYGHRRRYMNSPYCDGIAILGGLDDEQLTASRVRFAGRNDCCLRDAICLPMKSKLRNPRLSSRAKDLLYDKVFRTWAQRTRGQTLREEGWHAFGKSMNQEDRCWGSDFARQSCSQVLECQRREFVQRGNIVGECPTHTKAFAMQRIGAQPRTSRRQAKRVGFKVAPLKVVHQTAGAEGPANRLGTRRPRSVAKVVQHVVPLKRGGKAAYAFAASKCKGRSFGSREAYQDEMRLQIAAFNDLPPDEQEAFVADISAANVVKSLGEMSAALGVATPSTPWSMGDRKWPLRMELLEEGLARLGAGLSPTEMFGKIIGSVKGMLNKTVDEASIGRCATLQRLARFYTTHTDTMSVQPCWVAHWGFCRIANDGIATQVEALVKLLSTFTKTVPPSEEGQPLLRMVSAKHVAFVFQGKPSRNPLFQEYISHEIVGKAPVAGGQSLMAMHSKDQGKLPLVLQVVTRADGTLAHLHNYQLAVCLLETSLDWAFDRPSYRALDGERVEVLAVDTQKLGTVRQYVAGLKKDPGPPGGDGVGEDELDRAMRTLASASAAPPHAGAADVHGTGSSSSSSLAPSASCGVVATAFAKLVQVDCGPLDLDEEAVLAETIKAEEIADAAVDDALDAEVGAQVPYPVTRNPYPLTRDS